MQWFGRPSGAPYEADCPQVAAPVGAPCDWCDEPITADVDGVLLPAFGDPGGAAHAVFHYECHLRMAIGGVNHLRGRCICCGGNDPPDPPYLTKRQGALLALSVWQRRQL